MTLTKKHKKEILNQSFNYDDIIVRLNISKVKQKDKFLKMSGWLGQESQTIAETLETDKPAPLLLKMILRKEVLPERLINRIAQHFCEDFIKRLKKEAIYIDPRYDELLELKKQWIERKISQGIFDAAHHEARDLLAQSHRSKNKMMVAAAGAVHALLHPDARTGILRLFAIIDGIYKKEYQKRYDYLKTALMS